MTETRARPSAASSVRHAERPAAAGALIVGGAYTSIAVARSLGRHGVPVWLLAEHPLPRFSRYINRRFDWPGAAHPDGVSSILDLAAQHGLKGWVLIAAGDQEMRMIAQNHAVLSEHFRVATPSWDTVRWVYDKRLTYQRAALLRIDFPWSFQPRDREELWRLECHFPVILKPAFRKGAYAFTQAKDWRAETRAELLALYPRAVALAGNDSIIVQEWIPGTGAAQFSYAGLFERGEPIASVVARRTRQYPIDFGRSTFVETVEQPRVEELGRRFLKSIDYTGVAEVEFKFDERDGHYKLLDVNGCFWAWCGIGTPAGIELPYLAWRQALGDRLPTSRAWPGIGWVHASRDLMAASRGLMNGTLKLRDYLSGLRQPMTYATFAADDLLPAIVELPVAALHRLGGALRAAVKTGRRKGLRGRLTGIARLAAKPRRIARWRPSQPRAASASAPNTAKTKGLRSRL